MLNISHNTTGGTDYALLTLFLLNGTIALKSTSWLFIRTHSTRLRNLLLTPQFPDFSLSHFKIYSTKYSPLQMFTIPNKQSCISKEGLFTQIWEILFPSMRTENTNIIHTQFRRRLRPCKGVESDGLRQRVGDSSGVGKDSMSGADLSVTDSPSEPPTSSLLGGI